jgi:beta-glucanase (GH16 family)
MKTNLNFEKLKNFSKLVLLSLIGIFIFLNPVPITADPPPDYVLVWSDDFNGIELDKSKWIHWSQGQRRHAIDVPEAVSLEHGNLVIRTYTVDGKHYTGVISTEGIFEKQYGYWEASICFNDFSGTFSDFWLQSSTIGVPLNDPGKAGVEIDIVEHRVFDNDFNHISGINSINLHWGDYGEHSGWDGIETEDLGLGIGYHTYGLEWTKDYYKFYIDGRLVWTHTQVISHRPQFMIFSTEVQDMLWSGPIPKEGYGTKENTIVKMYVDYVRYYELRK